VSLTRTGFIDVPRGARPGFDHADVYRAGRRMYVGHTGADRVDVLDCERLQYVHSLDDLRGVAGVLTNERDDLLFTSDRGAARVSVFRCSDEQLLGRVEVGPHPNGLAYDEARRRLYSFNLGEPLGENCTTSVVDCDSFAVIAELALPGQPRWAAYDPERDVVYANIREPAQILVIDAQRAAVVQAYVVPGVRPARALARSRPALLRSRRPRPGRARPRPRQGPVEAATSGEPDVLMHDADLRRMYVAIGDPGVVCSFDSSSRWSAPNRARTRSAGTRTRARCTSSVRLAAARRSTRNGPELGRKRAIRMDTSAVPASSEASTTPTAAFERPRTARVSPISTEPSP
jgi:hypothetical protein